MIISSQVYHYPLNSHYHHLLPQLTPSRVFQLVFFFELFIYLAVLGLSCSMQDLQLQRSNSQLQHMGSSFLTKDRTWAPCIRSRESQPLDHQGSSWFFSFRFDLTQKQQHILSKLSKLNLLILKKIILLALNSKVYYINL